MNIANEKISICNQDGEDKTENWAYEINMSVAG